MTSFMALTSPFLLTPECLFNLEVLFDFKSVRHFDPDFDQVGEFLLPKNKIKSKMESCCLAAHGSIQCKAPKSYPSQPLPLCWCSSLTVTKIIKRHMERVTCGFRGLQSVLGKRQETQGKANLWFQGISVCHEEEIGDLG